MTASLLPLTAYRDLVELDRPFVPAASAARPDELDDLAARVLDVLAAEEDAPSPAGVSPRRSLRALLTVREARPLPAEAVPLLDALLGGEREARERTDAAALPSVADVFSGTRYPAARATALWRGDITTLAVDAIVNAANSGLRGCFLPEHRCIDNAVHAAAGPRLRADCDSIVRAQGSPEPAGAAKVTRGYHLPARYVLHTVGPVVSGRPSPEDAAALASAYRSCLDLAAEVPGIRTVAFCAISTGVFGYPVPEAAAVAVDAVASWLAGNPARLDRVVFDVFSEADYRIYAAALYRR